MTDSALPDPNLPLQSYRAAHERVAVCQLHPGIVEITGRDRNVFLHNFCTNDIKKLEPGKGCEAFLTNIKGRILEHLCVTAGEDSLWITLRPTGDTAVVSHLDRYLITEDAQLHLRTPDWTTWALVGPKAMDLAQQLWSVQTHGFQNGDHLSGFGPQNACRITRWDLTGTICLLLQVPTTAKEAVEKLLAEKQLASLSPELWNLLRIEHRFPAVGVDIGPDQIVQEARRTSQAVSFTKGCYLGQEPIARLDALGHVNRELCLLRFAATGSIQTPIETAQPTVFAGPDKKEVGRISSWAIHPANGDMLALALLRTSASVDETPVWTTFPGQPEISGRTICP